MKENEKQMKRKESIIVAILYGAYIVDLYLLISIKNDVFKEFGQIFEWIFCIIIVIGMWFKCSKINAITNYMGYKYKMLADKPMFKYEGNNKDFKEISDLFSLLVERKNTKNEIKYFIYPSICLEGVKSIDELKEDKKYSVKIIPFGLKWKRFTIYISEE